MACKKKSESGNEGNSSLPSSGSGFAKVSYQPAVHTVDLQETVRTLQGISSDGASLLFDSSNPQVANLKAGDVLLMKGLAARKIMAAETQGSQVILITRQASLPEVIKDGTVHLDAPIRFGTLQSQTPAPPAYLPEALRDLLPGTVYAQGPDSALFNQAQAKGRADAFKNLASGAVHSVVDGWDTKFSVTPAGGKVNIDIQLTKDVGGFRGKITGQGYLADFGFDSDIAVQQSTTERLEAGFKKINGLMNFTWEVAVDTPGGLTEKSRIKLPAAIEIPLYQYLDGLPLFLEISSAMIINPALTGGKEYSKGAFRITYDGYQHFSAKKGNIDSSGKVTGDIQILEEQNLSALAPLGMVVAFAAPRIELSFGVKKIFPMTDMQEAASKVDALADQLAKRVFSEEQYGQFKNALGDFSLSKAVSMSLGSEAAAYFEFVSSSGMSYSGSSVIVPCSHTDIHLTGKVGASAQAFGQSVGAVDKEIFRKDFSRNNPPGIKLCEGIGG
jgi:hypothetical protein